MHSHAHETQAEIALDVKNTGKRSLQRWADAGLLHDRLSLAHMVHLNDDEIKLVKASGLSIVHCPESNLKLGSGLADMVHLAEQGITIALGTDGAASNNDLDMFSELRTAGFLAKG